MALSSKPVQKVFNVIPRLSALIAGGGLPGVQYAYIDSANGAAAEAAGWMDVNTRGSQFFQIHGPSGESSCTLACKGRPIPGTFAGDGGSRLFIDPEILVKTGFNPESDLPYSAVVDEYDLEYASTPGAAAGDESSASPPAVP